MFLNPSLNMRITNTIFPPQKTQLRGFASMALGCMIARCSSLKVFKQHFLEKKNHFPNISYLKKNLVVSKLILTVINSTKSCLSKINSIHIHADTHDTAEILIN